MKKANKRNHSDIMLITLCSKCVRDYYNSPEHIVRPANKSKTEYEPCCKCPSRKGLDYSIQRKVKSR